MRKLLGVIAASFLAIGVAGQAHAVALGFTGSITISLVGNNVSLPGSGTATVNGSGAGGHLTALSLAGGEFATAAFVLPITDPAAAPIKGLQVTASNAAGAFVGSGGAGFGGTMGLNGFTKVCLFGPCSAAVANLAVPLAPVGVGGFAQVTAAVNLTVIGAPWTTGTAAVGTVTAMGGVSPLSSTGMASGNVTLVTPVFVSTNIAPSAVVPVFAIMSLHFVPEPGTLVLLGSGIAGLVAFGRSSRNRK
jgi:PEP-CTERM motif